MAANVDPIYSVSANVTQNNSTAMNQLVTAAANDYTGISANNSLIFTAGANGSFVQRIRLKAGGTNVASVMRFYINNGATAGTATNNQFFGEVSLPATTAIATSATIEIDYPVGFAIPATYRIYMGLGTAVAAGWVAACIGGNY